MLNYIALYPNEYEDMMNPDIILGAQDTPIEDFIIMAMQEFEAIDNIKIENIKVVRDQDEVDINRHTININYKKKNIEDIEFPKYKYISDSRYGEIIFGIRVTTNLNEKFIEKRILYPYNQILVFLGNNYLHLLLNHSKGIIHKVDKIHYEDSIFFFFYLLKRCFYNKNHFDMKKDQPFEYS